MILDLTRTGKPNDIRDYIVFENLRVQSGFRPYENEKRAFFKFLRFEAERFGKVSFS